MCILLLVYLFIGSNARPPPVLSLVGRLVSCSLIISKKKVESYTSMLLFGHLFNIVPNKNVGKDTTFCPMRHSGASNKNQE